MATAEPPVLDPNRPKQQVRVEKLARRVRHLERSLERVRRRAKKNKRTSRVRIEQLEGRLHRELELSANQSLEMRRWPVRTALSFTRWLDRVLGRPGPKI